MASGYTYNAYDKELMARAMGRGLPISTKQSIEVCSRIRNKHVKQAKQLLTDAIEGKRAIRYTRFNGDVGHKPGMAAGRFPAKTATGILSLIKSAEANAQVKGLNTGNLYIVHVNAQKASAPMHQGRQRGTSMKRTHVEIVLQERAGESIAKKAKQTPKETKKKAVIKKAPEFKQETPKIEVKAEKEVESQPIEKPKIEKKAPDKTVAPEIKEKAKQVPKEKIKERSQAKTKEEKQDTVETKATQSPKEEEKKG